MIYDPKRIENKWQAFWGKNRTFEAELQSKKPKYYILDMLPYPSSSGLHVGHPEGYTATDIIARYKRAKGFNVLHPMGWDAFGLPAEQYALKTGIHPKITISNAIQTFKRQLKSIGLSYDWSRELSTSDPSFYKWTQFLFLKLHEKGLAYQKEVPVNWCPELKTVLANEEVVHGKSERGGHPVFRVLMRQWMLKITSYAERLLEDLNTLDWPESTKQLQRHWIGKSEGAEIYFPVFQKKISIEVFTTRPETLFGASYLALAPENPLVDTLTEDPYKEEMRIFQTKVSQKSELSRQAMDQEKTGVFTGSYAVHPKSQKKIPIWVSDYVLNDYGNGAIMAVPAHDERDYAFAKKYNLPVQKVIQSPDLKETVCHKEEGLMIHSDFLTGMTCQKAKEATLKWLEEEGLGLKKTQYKLRDWLFSRQRYWGEPFPIVYLENGEKKEVPLKDLPIRLPDVENYEPSGTGESPLAKIKSWKKMKDPETGMAFFRETDTMPGSAGSSWYFLRYCDPNNMQAPFSTESEKYWMPVDLYLGGAEHAVGHLLYARFWTKVFYDAGLVSCSEPFKKLVHQGMILGEDGEKMSKSRGNVINPDTIIDQYGADTLRIYEMFMGPLEKDKPWSTTAIEGVYRFLQRIWRLFYDDCLTISDFSPSPYVKEVEPLEEHLRILHKTIKKVTEDIELLRFNTAISQMMIFVNHMTQYPIRPTACMKPFIQILNPFAPHLAEELWACLGEKTSLTYTPWPCFESKWTQDLMLTIAIQVMGKTRATLQIQPETSQEEIEELAKKLPRVIHAIKEKKILKVIFIKNRILNFVLG